MEEQGHSDIEPVVENRVGPSQSFAEQMKKSGVQCEALEIGSQSIEHGPYYSYLFALSPRFVTNKGAIRIRGRNIDFVQVLQRN
ncbi:MAG: hypothetical protein MN733_10170 [Nitrososphaera sp.]|nr:hypothetical protein [Nitrososphaera sp.]